MTQPINPRDVPFMVAVADSERLLRELERGWEPPPPTSQEIRDATRDALNAIARDMPDPAEFAMSLQGVFAMALAHAVQGVDREVAGAWCIAASGSHLLPYLRSMGLVHVRHRTLTEFGLRVRAELMKDER